MTTNSNDYWCGYIRCDWEIIMAHWKELLRRIFKVRLGSNLVLSNIYSAVLMSIWICHVGRVAVVWYKPTFDGYNIRHSTTQYLMMSAAWGLFVLTTFLPIALGALTPSSIISLVQSGYQGGILVPGIPGFTNATLAWSLNFNEHPVLALQPTCVNDVSLAVSTCLYVMTPSLIKWLPAGEMAS